MELVEGIGPKRAARLAASFARARPAYETAELLIACRVPARFAGSAVALLGPAAARQLRADPWKLLQIPQIRPDQADWFARQLLDGQASRQDPRRGRALVVHLLVKAARDGHTAVPAEAVLTALNRFGVDEPGPAVVAAIDDGSVLPFEAFGAAEDPDGEAGERSSAKRALRSSAKRAQRSSAKRAQRSSAKRAQRSSAKRAQRSSAKRAQRSSAKRRSAVGEAGAAQFGEAEATAAADVGAPDVGAPDVGAADAADVDQPADDDAVGPGTLLALTQYAIAEESVAEGLQRLAATAEPIADTPTAADGADAELDDRQRAAVEAVAEHGVSVLTGGPGTGKSRTVAAVVALAAASGLSGGPGRPDRPGCQTAGRAGRALATTLHRLLGAQGRGLARSGSAGPDGGAADGDGLFTDAGAPGAAADAGGFPRGTGESGSRDGSWVFARGEEWPLDADLVVVDESSMLDVELAAALVEACADGTRLLLVGDPAQLPSIGPGRVLADIIDSGAVPVTELTTLYRQRAGGTIAKLGHRRPRR